ncbi:MAG TPA: tyrosine-type recombinase/integrase [Actinomycetes bacterium]|nr:tyrosine-type recombinase/integrase [Actinomycetes bacterium]
MHQHLNTWAEWMRATGATDKTVETRLYGIRSLIAHSGQTDPTAFTTRQIVGWLAACRNPWTRRTYHITARQWHRWLLDRGLRSDDPTAVIPPPRTPRSTPRPAPTIAITTLLRVAPRRARAYIVLGVYEGLRCCEIARIRGEHFDGDRFYVEGKGGDGKWMPVHPLVAQLRRGYPAVGFWFPGVHDGHVSAKAVSRTVSLAFRRTGHNVTAHQLRHWFGTMVLRHSGGDIRVVQELLRHASLQSSQVYTQVDSTARTSAVRRLAA